MAIIIEEQGNGILFNGNLTDKQGWVLSPSSDQTKVVLTNRITGLSGSSDVTEVEVDGNTFADYDALVAALGDVLFKNGGGDGSGVTWDQVTDKPLYTLGTPIQDAEGLIPVYTQNGQLPVGMPEFPENAVPLILLDVRAPELEEGNFLVGGASGNEQRTLTGLDIKAATAGSATRVARVGSDGTIVGSYGIWADNPNPNTAALRTTTGQVKVATAVAPDDAVTLSQAQSMVAGVYKFKGSVADEASLPTEDNIQGDVWNTLDTDMNFAWTGTEWDPLATSVDLTAYYNKTEADGLLDGKVDVGGVLPSDLGLTTQNTVRLKSSDDSWIDVTAGSTAIPGNIARWSTGGRMNVAAATISGEAVNLGQLDSSLEGTDLTDLPTYNEDAPNGQQLIHIGGVLQWVDL